jgi:2-polyprenyl-3-methyl-5-hydroxy-6-metoxy-1,4-benzoquinol methylase
MNQKQTSAVDYSKYEKWKGWDKLFSYNKDQADYFRGETADIAVRGANVLEIGFGSGDFLQWASDQGALVYGTEMNDVLLEAARERGISLLDASFERIAALYADHFDSIVAFDVFEHFLIEEVVEKIAACELMLKPGGKLLMRFPNGQSPFGLLPQNGDVTHRTSLSRSVLEQLVQERRLKVVHYSHPYRARGRSLGTAAVRFVRQRLRNFISTCLNFIYTTKISYDPVVVLILEKFET